MSSSSHYENNENPWVMWSVWSQDQPISYLQFQSSLCHPLARKVRASKGCRYTVDMLPRPQARPAAATALTLVSPAGSELKLQGFFYVAAVVFVCLQVLYFPFWTCPNYNTPLCVTMSPLSSMTGVWCPSYFADRGGPNYNLSKGNVLHLWFIIDLVNRLKVSKIKD